VLNEDDFVSQLRSILQKTDEHVLRIQADTWGIVFKAVNNKPGSYELKPIITDLDGVDTGDRVWYQQAYRTDKEGLRDIWKKENLDFLSSALRGIYPGDRDHSIAFDKHIMSKLK
jgi:hypothetical protein